MAAWLALDLSLSSTGFALWDGDSEAPVIGHWKLADEMKWRARGYVRLHKSIMELHRATPLDYIFFEEPLDQKALNGHTNTETLQTLSGLAAHTESFASAIGATHRAVNISSWRRHFIGSMPRGTKSADLKWMTQKRCRELGFQPVGSDEADALGILDYSLSVNGILPPWRSLNILDRQMTPAADGKAAG